jgi:diguanylate cyclase (GGDEF)-like protein
MSRALRVLLVEDSEDDATLLLRELRKGGYQPECRRVDSGEELQAALAGARWDIVITDHNLPGFSSEAALATVRGAGIDVPVIIVSGSIGEDIAVAAMKNGAHDYIMKGNLARLVPAIERELREAETRRAHRRAQETIHHLAFHDALTGLANRHEFEDRVRGALATASQGARHALLYVDLDQFKIINDTCGHTAGDGLLRQLAVVLRGPIREVDTLARLGGDEFGVLLYGCSQEHAQRVADRMLEIIKDFRYVWQHKTFSIGASIGLVMLDDPRQTLSDVLRIADMACYVAKDKGRNRVHVYRADDAELLQRHGEMEWVARLKRALEADQFVLHRQFIVPLAEGEKRSGRHSEFLVRLRADDGGLIEPGAFIPAAERYGLMPSLDRWVVRNVFGHLAQQLERSAVGEASFINVSGASVSEDPFAEYVIEQLRRHRLPAGMIGFEITETAVIANLGSALAFIERVKALGCRIALDDFGSGMSSFSYLKTIPADFLKIDGGFIKGMLDDPMDTAIVESINRVGHVAGLKTIAESVETAAVRQRLAEIGVDYGQGFAIERPVPLQSTTSQAMPDDGLRQA